MRCASRDPASRGLSHSGPLDSGWRARLCRPEPPVSSRSLWYLPEAPAAQMPEMCDLTDICHPGQSPRKDRLGIMAQKRQNQGVGRPVLLNLCW